MKDVDLDTIADAVCENFLVRVDGKRKLCQFLADYLKVEFDDVHNAFGFFEHETKYVVTIETSN